MSFPFVLSKKGTNLLNESRAWKLWRKEENSYVLHLKLESLQGHISGDSSLLSTQWRTPSHTRSGLVSFKYSEQVHTSGSSDPSKQSFLRSQNALRSTHFPFLHRSSILVQSSIRYIYILSEILLSNFPYFPCQCNLNYYCLCLCCTHCSLPRRSRNFLGILRNIPIPRPPCPDNPEHRRKHDSGGCSGRCCIENRYTSIQRSTSLARLSNLRISMKLLWDLIRPTDYLNLYLLPPSGRDLCTRYLSLFENLWNYNLGCPRRRLQGTIPFFHDRISFHSNLFRFSMR